MHPNRSLSHSTNFGPTYLLSEAVLSLRALCLLCLLCDCAVVLRLILSQRRVRLDIKDRSTLYGSFQEEPSRCYQITITLGVGEGIA